MKGAFFTFEGGEGSGKTTLVGLVAERLRSCGREVVTTREPGGVAVAEQIRAVILDAKNTAMDPRTEALLFAAARRQHFVEKIGAGPRSHRAVRPVRGFEPGLPGNCPRHGRAADFGNQPVRHRLPHAGSDVLPVH